MAHFINCTSCGKQYNIDAFEECPFCGFSPNGKTVICPNRLCGKEVSDKFDHCPFCHTLLIKPTKTAEDIINEHKRKEEDLKDAIRKQYNIDGDISEEQYVQLREIYLKEHGNRNDANKKESPSGQRNGSVGWVIGILAALIILLIIFFASGGGHSKTYNEYMSRIKSREAAIKSATSLFDMKKLDERILSVGADEYLTDGDEKRAVVSAHDRAWELFDKKCEQLSVGKYKLTTKNGHTYIIELTNEVIKDKGYSTDYLARIHKDNGLLGVGEWSSSGVKSYINFKQDPNNFGDDIEITIYVAGSSQTLKWYGKIEKNKYGRLDNDEGTVEKIE